MSDELRLVGSSAEDPEDLAVLRRGVHDYNTAITGWHDFRPIILVLRDRAGHVQGGLAAYVWGGWLQIEYVWISEPYRRQGWGSSLIETAEATGWSAGARHAYVETFSFQARPFYERHGYRVVGELTDFPPNESYYLMRKDLSSAGP
jgi:GNAT superfamily N-acetyltransferase